jgi:hypothetical protein
MKKLILITLLLPVIVMAQSKPVTMDTVKFKGYSISTMGSATFSKSAGTIKQWTVITTDTKPAMTISHPDSNGVIKVWIDRKRVTWTSDSTFTLQSYKQ